MPIAREIVEEHIFGGVGELRFTQDSPIMPDVWIAFASGTDRQDLLFSPHSDKRKKYAVKYRDEKALSLSVTP